MKFFDKGTSVRTTVSFVDKTTGQPVDPATVRCLYKNSGGQTTLTYGTDNAVVKDSTGNYHVDLNANVVGQWWFRWESTGANQGAYEDSFEIRPSQF